MAAGHNVSTFGDLVGLRRLTGPVQSDMIWVAVAVATDYSHVASRRRKTIVGGFDMDRKSIEGPSLVHVDYRRDFGRMGTHCFLVEQFAEEGRMTSAAVGEVAERPDAEEVALLV